VTRVRPFAAGLVTMSICAVPAVASAQDLPPPSTGTPNDASNPANQPSTPPADGAAQPSQATKLDKEEKKDEKRRLEWLYLNADAGFSYISMDSISASSLSVQNASSAGPTFGLAAGIRLFILTLGVRANLHALSSFNLWQMDAELAFHIPIGHWEPYIGFHGGYCFVGSLDDGLSGSSNISINGGDAGMQIGLDYYFNHYVSLGLDVSANALFLTGTSTVPAIVPGSAQSGDSIGLGVAPSLHLGFHL
jgi:hypothetical protein